MCLLFLTLHIVYKKLVKIIHLEMVIESIFAPKLHEHFLICDLNYQGVLIKGMWFNNMQKIVYITGIFMVKITRFIDGVFMECHQLCDNDRVMQMKEIIC